jgi:hypothetical protein
VAALILKHASKQYQERARVHTHTHTHTQTHQKIYIYHNSPKVSEFFIKQKSKTGKRAIGADGALLLHAV